MLTRLVISVLYSLRRDCSVPEEDGLLERVPHGLSSRRSSERTILWMMQQMMGGMLPPGIKSQDLPEPESRGAKLLNTYCSQCHNLPSPRMHTAEDWPRVAGRTLSRERIPTLVIIPVPIPFGDVCSSVPRFRVLYRREFCDRKQ